MSAPNVDEKVSPPLTLSQVLEEEYERLHVELPSDYKQEGSSEERRAAACCSLNKP